MVIHYIINAGPATACFEWISLVPANTMRFAHACLVNATARRATAFQLRRLSLKALITSHARKRCGMLQCLFRDSGPSSSQRVHANEQSPVVIEHRDVPSLAHFVLPSLDDALTRVHLRRELTEMRDRTFARMFCCLHISPQLTFGLMGFLCCRK